MTQFESLANELSADFFEYLDAVYLLHAFDDLNSRFNTILYRHVRAYHLDLRRISRQNFDIFCQQRPLSIADRIVSLHLADHNETPGLPNLFLYDIFTVSRIINLRSLSLHDINFVHFVRVLEELHLDHIIYLYIRASFNIGEQRHYAYRLINNIWKLPKLTHFKFDTYQSLYGNG